MDFFYWFLSYFRNERLEVHRVPSVRTMPPPPRRLNVILHRAQLVLLLLGVLLLALPPPLSAVHEIASPFHRMPRFWGPPHQTNRTVPTPVVRSIMPEFGQVDTVTQIIIEGDYMTEEFGFGAFRMLC